MCEKKMKPCFGIGFGGFMEGLIGDYDTLEKCYACPDYDQCHKMTMVRESIQLRLEVRRAARVIGLGMGGCHSTRPFG